MPMPVRTLPALKIVDSITQLNERDCGCIAISGSHGGLSSAKYALAARPLLSVFNDAGVGKDGAGIAALAVLQANGLAACTVSHDSACIGQADSSLQNGIITHCNALALSCSMRPGQRLAQALNHQWPGSTPHPRPLSTPQE